MKGALGILFALFSGLSWSQSPPAIPSNGAEEQSRNVVFSVQVLPEPESWATGTNCTMSARANAGSQPRWIQFTPYTGSEPWTFWKVIDFKITIGGETVFTGQSALEEQLLGINQPIRYASTHFENGKVTLKVSAKFVFYRNGVQGEVRELSATTQVVVYNKLFAWSTWWTSDGKCEPPAAADDDDGFPEWNGSRSGPQTTDWVPATIEDQRIEASCFSLVGRNICQAFWDVNPLRIEGLPNPLLTNPKFLFSRTAAAGPFADTSFMDTSFDTGLKLATIFVSAGHGTSTSMSTKGLETSKHLELIPPVGPISIKSIVGLRAEEGNLYRHAPRPSLAVLYSCFGTEDNSYLDPLQVQLTSEFVTVDRAIAGFSQDIGMLQVAYVPSAPTSTSGRAFVVRKNCADTHARVLAERLKSGDPLYLAVAAAKQASSLRFVSSGDPAEMTILGDPFYKLDTVYIYPEEYLFDWDLIYQGAWYIAL